MVLICCACARQSTVTPPPKWSAPERRWRWVQPDNQAVSWGHGRSRSELVIACGECVKEESSWRLPAVRRATHSTDHAAPNLLFYLHKM